MIDCPCRSPRGNAEGAAAAQLGTGAARGFWSASVGYAVLQAEPTQSQSVFLMIFTISLRSGALTEPLML